MIILYIGLFYPFEEVKTEDSSDMQMNFDMDNDTGRVINIKVVGVGGGGGNAVNHMVVSEVQGVEFISLNTDRQALMKSKATLKTVIGEKTCKGGGAGGNPDVGQ